MKTRFASVLLLFILALTLALAACKSSGVTPQMPQGSQPISTSARTSVGQASPTGPVAPTWIEPISEGDTASISLAEVQGNIMSHFEYTYSGKKLTFMAYVFNEAIYIRADICPPCRSKSFTLAKDKLVCDSCGTVFEASTGAGFSGACVAFPKAEVSYTVQNGNLVMNTTDLVTAYQETLASG
jgi:hypothetical protein